MSRLVHLRFLFTFLITVLAYTAVAKLDKPSDVLSQGATSFCCNMCSAFAGAFFQKRAPSAGETRFSSKIGSLVPEYALQPDQSVSLVKVASR